MATDAQLIRYWMTQYHRQKEYGKRAGVARSNIEKMYKNMLSARAARDDMVRRQLAIQQLHRLINQN
jgi:hypothetical protein